MSRTQKKSGFKERNTHQNNTQPSFVVVDITLHASNSSHKYFFKNKNSNQKYVWSALSDWTTEKITSDISMKVEKGMVANKQTV